MGGTSVSTCITRSGLARSLAEDRSFYLRRRRRRSGKETGTISRFGRSAPSSSRAFPLPSLFMNSLRPSHQRDACPRSLHNHAHPALRMSSPGRSRVIRPPTSSIKPREAKVRRVRFTFSRLAATRPPRVCCDRGNSIRAAGPFAASLRAAGVTGGRDARDLPFCRFSPRKHRSGRAPAARKRWSCPTG